MSCAEFENRLTALMAGELPEAERAGAQDALRRHAARCEACAGFDDLLDVLGRPAGQRDVVEDPGQAYWDGFDERLKRRLVEQPARPRPTRRYWVAAAAALLLALSGIWFRQLIRTDAGSVATVPPGSSAELARALDDVLARVPAEVAIEELEALAGSEDAWVGALGNAPYDPAWEEPGDLGGWLFPDATNLDDAARKELLVWLEEQGA